jgi:hypothetical protein
VTSASRNPYPSAICPTAHGKIIPPINAIANKIPNAVPEYSSHLLTAIQAECCYKRTAKERQQHRTETKEDSEQIECSRLLLRPYVQVSDEHISAAIKAPPPPPSNNTANSNSP